MQILSELDIENKVVKWALEHDFLTPKVKFAEKGWPDRLFLSPLGHTIFIEFKSPGDKADPLQWYRIMELKKRGIPAFCVDSIIEGINILKAALESSSVSGASNPPAAVASIGRAVSRPGIGEDIHCPGGDKDPEGEGPNYESPDSSPTPSNERSVATGDRKMGRFPGDDVDNPSWAEESNKYLRILIDPPDKS